MAQSESQVKNSNMDGGAKPKRKTLKDKKTKTPKTKTSKKKVVKKVNPWLVHVKKTMKLHPNKDFKDILKLAGKTYKK